ncbi:MAG: hypothetical protein WA705_00595 [Candidatus Ozemobacteraceae bacterium]
MSRYYIDSLNQKLEFRSYRIYFAMKDGLRAEEIIDSLDRATAGIMSIFCLPAEPVLEMFLYPDIPSFEGVIGRSLSAGESIRILYEEKTLLMATPCLSNLIGEEIVRNLGYLLFHQNVKERDVALHQLRTPSWLREGICLQTPCRMRPQSNSYLMDGWSRLQEAESGDKLIKLSAMVKNIFTIPDPARRQLAIHQAFYMVKYLLGIYCNKFVQRYGTMMRAIEDMPSEDAFRQVISFGFDKFYALFREWVRSTNALMVMND